MQILSDWKFWTLIIAVCSFLFSIFNLIVGKIVATKLTENDLKHITADIETLKKNDEKRSENIYCELKKIFKRIGIIDKRIVKRDAICEERHKKD